MAGNSPEISAWLRASVPLRGGGAEVTVEGGEEEARVAVVLHQAVDFGLGTGETGWGRAGQRQSLLDGVPGEVVQVHLRKDNDKHTHRTLSLGRIKTLQHTGHFALRKITSSKHFTTI